MSEVRSSKRISQTVDAERKKKTEEVEALRKQQREAIKKLDYAEAERISKEIEAINDRTTNATLNTVMSEYEDAMTAAIQQIKENEILSKERQKLREYELKERVDKQFKSIQQKQLAQLNNLETKLKNDLTLEATRSVPEAQEMVDTSRKVAMSGDFAKAQQLLDESRKFAKEDKEKRIAQCQEQFSISREELISGFAAEMEKLTKKLHYEEEILNQKYEEELRVTAINNTNSLSGLCQKYMKIANSYGQGQNGARLAHEIQESYINICKENNIEPTQVHVEQNLTNKKKISNVQVSRIPSRMSTSSQRK